MSTPVFTRARQPKLQLELPGPWRGVAATLAVVLSMAPAPSFAAPPADDVAPAEGVTSATEGDAATPESGEASQPPGEDSPADSPAGELQPTVVELEEPDAPTGGGVAGAIIDPDDPNATRAQSDLEGESLDTDLEGVPDRLPKLQTAGWWTTFTAVALATTGGIFAGVAETRQDDAERLAYSFDLDTGRAALYGSVADDYQRLLDQGGTYQWVARGFIIAGGVALIAGVAMFAVDGTRRRKAERSETARLQLDPGPTGLRLRF